MRGVHPFPEGRADRGPRRRVGAGELDERPASCSASSVAKNSVAPRPSTSDRSGGLESSTGRHEAHASKTTLSGAPDRVLLTSAHERPRSAGTSLRAIGPPSVDGVTETELVDEPAEAAARLLVARAGRDVPWQRSRTSTPVRRGRSRPPGRSSARPFDSA